MTETSPVGGMAHPPIDVELGTAEEMDWRMKSGRLLAGVQMRIVDDDGAGLPWDGVAVGEMEVRGPWITGAYHRDAAPEKFDDGWLRTGDIGTIDDARLLPDHRPVEGRDQVRRRVDLLGRAGEPARRHRRTCSRPRSSASRTTSGPSARWPAWCTQVATSTRRGARRRILDGKVASWQVPENWTFIDEVPKTTVGKFDKKVLRARYADGDLDVTRTRD